ncbi:MAG TPA: heparan-alpha-glucosaminide N-acetyltransferase domain-containing protein [Thermoanaerobaculia bacterium]|jgi:predicted acyltransferase|nr:heparan-alpha-glucosaminide N-acetyltransferase domain-containing protein [Thermoanaerobaculia bacterium]
MQGSASPESGERPPVRGERLVALDVFRGVTIAAMLLVNNPGSWSAIYGPLEHAEWHGWTPTDLIFPFFLFIVGITTHLSRKEPKRIVRRGLLIVLLGLLLNAFPFFWWGKMAGFAQPTFLDRVAWRFEHLRFAGVLQRIGIAYIAAALISLYATRRQIIITIAAILIGYWVLMTCVPVPGTGELGAFVLDQPPKTLAAWLDRAILGTNHIWSSTKTWDPEGPLSTLPAIATALLGVLAGAWLTRRDKPLIERVAKLYGAGCLAMLAGKLWDWVFPINKNLWTSSYVLFTAGFACVALATCLWLIDVEGRRGWTKPFVIYGVNPMAAFVGSGLMARLIDSLIKVRRGNELKSLHAMTFEWVNLPWFSPKFASLLWGLGFVALWLGILTLLHRRGLILKV